MEDVSKAIGFILTNNTPVTNAVGSGNIYHARVPQQNDSKTYLRWYVDRTDPVNVKNHRAYVYNVFVRLEIYSNVDDTIVAIAKAVRDALDRYAHTTVNTVTLNGAQYLGGEFFPELADDVDLMGYVQEYKFRVIERPA